MENMEEKGRVRANPFIFLRYNLDVWHITAANISTLPWSELSHMTTSQIQLKI
jgi:hypothetical protein